MQINSIIQTRDNLVEGGASGLRLYYSGIATRGGKFTIAGSGRFADAPHIRYKAEKPAHDGAWTIVSQLTEGGNDVEVRIGYLRNKDGEVAFRPTAGERKAPSRAGKALDTVISLVNNGRIPRHTLIWGSGKCAYCGRDLTDPESIKRGVGPICVERALIIMDVRPRLLALAEKLDDAGFDDEVFDDAPAAIRGIDAGHAARIFGYIGRGDINNCAQGFELIESLGLPDDTRALYGTLCAAVGKVVPGDREDRREFRERIFGALGITRWPSLPEWWLPTTEETDSARAA